jgi:hypothetical protein
MNSSNMQNPLDSPIAGGYQLSMGPLHAIVDVQTTIYHEGSYLGDETSDGNPVVTDSQFTFQATTVGGPAVITTDGVSTFTPTTGQIGDHTFTVRQRENLRLVDRFDTPLHIRAPIANLGKVLSVGDSISAAGIWQASLTLPVTLIGSQTAYGINHEAYSGKQWTWFATDAASPFVYGGVIDIPHYLSSVLGDTPEVVVWLLFTNSVFTTAIPDTTIPAEVAYAETLIAAWQAVDSNIKHLVLLPAPGNGRESAYVDNYNGAIEDMYRWEYRHRMACRLALAQFKNRESSKIYVADMSNAIDRFAGYPELNALHPHLWGHQELALRITAALNYVVGG